jgi:selenocysteine-specific elongation factor
VKQIILGTAGHIDHGKTSLIKAITGTNTDRLKEEQKRGITIELGFASLDLPSGRHLGIVDVPGHEKFVKNMVAGATGIDIVCMVIAADEGVMPQTREHMEICTLLGVRTAWSCSPKSTWWMRSGWNWSPRTSAISPWAPFWKRRRSCRFLRLPATASPNSSKRWTPCAQEVPERATTGLFRLPVDRVFSMKGFGTVITGTLISGKVNVGDAIMIYPGRDHIQSQGHPGAQPEPGTAEAGMRTAINFQGLEKTAINRGDILARENTLTPSYMVDLELHFLKASNKTDQKPHPGAISHRHQRDHGQPDPAGPGGA